MESQKVVVVVEEAAAARAALEWAVRNYIRGGDTITLLHVCPRATSKKKQRNLRLRGFQLALAFRELCDGIAEAKVEIIVTEGDETATVVVSIVNKIGATTLVAGLHDQSFLYRAQDLSYGMRSLGCRVLAIKQHAAMREGFVNAEFFQIETARLCPISEPKIPYQIFPLSFGMICRRSRRKKG